MKFHTKIVEANKNPRARVAWGGGVLAGLGMILTCWEPYRMYGLWLFGIGVMVMIVGTLVARGDVDVIDISATDLIIDSDEIRIGESGFLIGILTDIEFQVEGYDGMLNSQGGGNIGGQSSRYRNYNNGMNNFLSFVCGSEKNEWQFYLQDAQHVQVLGQLFKEWYAKGIAFREQDQGGQRTFLFAPVTEEEWKDQMTVNGYAVPQ